MNPDLIWCLIGGAVATLAGYLVGRRHGRQRARQEYENFEDLRGEIDIDSVIDRTGERGVASDAPFQTVEETHGS